MSKEGIIHLFAVVPGCGSMCASSSSSLDSAKRRLSTGTNESNSNEARCEQDRKRSCGNDCCLDELQHTEENLPDPGWKVYNTRSKKKWNVLFENYIGKGGIFLIRHECTPAVWNVVNKNKQTNLFAILRANTWFERRHISDKCVSQKNISLICLFPSKCVF